GVEAQGQADAYASKPWGHLVAPTNRRPFGFDWEDWGRLDALEVLDHAQQLLQTDPQRTYLTGHSMGGHGAWQVGATYPDRFAATLRLLPPPRPATAGEPARRGVHDGLPGSVRLVPLGRHRGAAAAPQAQPSQDSPRRRAAPLRGHDGERRATRPRPRPPR